MSSTSSAAFEKVLHAFVFHDRQFESDDIDAPAEPAAEKRIGCPVKLGVAHVQQRRIVLACVAFVQPQILDAGRAAPQRERHGIDLAAIVGEFGEFAVGDRSRDGRTDQPHEQEQHDGDEQHPQ
ncbi:MAG: hypothetical protein NVV63_07520 [Opitutus sp.]|nr:hypothetical protein [Opitutus sp.]